jgi:hypothetical protein
MQEISLTQGKVALVDDEDFEWLNRWKWCAIRTPYTFYAARCVGEGLVYMHREIAGLQGLQIDHRDRNGLNNQRYNLRAATSRQNVRNKGVYANNRFGLKGVYWNKSCKKFRAQIKVSGRSIHLGFFEDVFSAALAYNKAAVKYFGEFAWLNPLLPRWVLPAGIVSRPDHTRSDSFFQHRVRYPALSAVGAPAGFTPFQPIIEGCPALPYGLS